jgi:hypothetical protein
MANVNIPARNFERDADAIELPRAVVAVRGVDDHATTDYAIMEAFKPCGLLTNARLNGRRSLHVLKGDLKRRLHGRNSSSDKT